MYLLQKDWMSLINISTHQFVFYVVRMLNLYSENIGMQTTYKKKLTWSESPSIPKYMSYKSLVNLCVWMCLCVYVPMCVIPSEAGIERHTPTETCKFKVRILVFTVSL